MTTGAPIYLVSACGSGEEFVAAFRRYADRAGLFVPMADPVPAGRKGQFALTLADGRVMLEGEAEVISSGLTPSLLHGRVGMTLRFVEPDDNTRTVLVELEKARLSMRPPAPSVPPRQADVPPQPRAVPPAPGGRIDLHNALAQSVAIGDLEQLAVVDKPAPKAGPKFVVPAIPPMGQRGRTTSAPPPTPSATRPPPFATAATGDGEPTGPAVIHDAPPVPRMARDSEQTALVPPPSAPHAAPSPAPSPAAPPARPSPSPSSPPPLRPAPSPTSPPARPSPTTPPARPSPSPSSPPPTRPSPAPAARPAAASGTSPPPISERFLRVRQDSEQTAFTPPPTPPVPAEPGRQRAPRDSEQTAAGPAPTPIAVPRTRTLRDPEQAVPPPPAPLAQVSPIATQPAPRATPPAPRATPPSTPPANVRGAPAAAATAPSAPPPAAEQRSSPRVRSPRDSDEQTAAGPPPGPPPAQPAPRLAQPATESGPVLPRTQTTSGHEPSPAVPRAPQPGLFAPAGKARPIRDSEETAIVSQGDVRAEASVPVPTDGSDASNGVTTRSPALSPPEGVPVVVGTQTPPDALPVVPRTTTPTTRNADDDEPTDLSAVPQALDPYLPGSAPESHVKGGKRRTVIGMPVSASGASDVRPARPSQPPFGVPEPLTAASASGPTTRNEVDAHAPTLPAAGPHAPLEEHTPSGDWVFTPTAEGPQLAPRVEARDKLPTGDWTIQLEGDTWSEPSRPDAVPVTTPPTTPAQKRAAPGQHPVPQPQGKPEKPKRPGRKSEPKIGPPQPFVAGSHESPPAAAPPSSSEPKIQIDPTLIEPLQPMPAEPPLGGSGPHLPGPVPQQPYPSGGFALEPPPRHMGYPQQSGSHMAPPFSPQSTGPHPYPLQPTGPHPVAFPAMPTNPHAFPPVPTGQHTAFPRTGPHARPKRPTMPPRPTANRILVIGASALLVAVFGGAAYIVFGGMSDDDEDTTTPPTTPTPAPSTNPATPPPNDAAATGSATGGGDATASTTPPPAPAEGQPAQPLASPPPAGVGSSCIVDIASTPTGAEVVLDATVLGITPAQLPLPCDAPVKLLVRKPTYVAQQRTVTPTRDGGDKLKVALVRVTYVVKVSSSPPGATITLNGKSIGTTPATVKLPAFETAMLAIGKDGYSTETEHVTPKTNNQTVHSVLKKTPLKRLK